MWQVLLTEREICAHPRTPIGGRGRGRERERKRKRERDYLTRASERENMCVCEERGREKERERESERAREGGRERGREREGGREGEGERGHNATYLMTMQPPSGMPLIGTSTEASASTSAEAFM